MFHMQAVEIRVLSSAALCNGLSDHITYQFSTNKGNITEVISCISFTKVSSITVCRNIVTASERLLKYLSVSVVLILLQVIRIMAQE